MISTIARLSAGAGMALSLSMPATAEPIKCGPHDVVTSMLGEQYQEKRKAIGLSTAGMLMEVFASSTGTWTVLLTSPAGTACIIAEGDSFEQIESLWPEA
jgi:hypothetical protein